MWQFKNKEILSLTQEAIIAKRHVALRPTRLCLSLLALSVAIWIGAVNYQVNVAYLVCFWVMGFVGVSALLTWRQLLGLRVEVVFNDEVFAGQTADANVFFSNGAGKRTRTLWWRGELADNNTHATDERHLSDWQRMDITQHHINQATWSIPIAQRGYFPEPLLLYLVSSAPFGLFQAMCQVQWQTDAVAYASPLPHQDFGTANQPDTEQTSQQAGMHGDDIAYLKNHQQGSSLQHVAWKVYAKRGELMDKVFDEPPPAQHSEVISYCDYPQGTPKDKLASLMTHRVLQADKWGASYTLELPHVTITPQNKLREKCLNALALM